MMKHAVKVTTVQINGVVKTGGQKQMFSNRRRETVFDVNLA